MPSYRVSGAIAPARARTAREVHGVTILRLRVTDLSPSLYCAVIAA
jgi:hypothetical protein